jgi:hypothetical protein
MVPWWPACSPHDLVRACLHTEVGCGGGQEEPHTAEESSRVVMYEDLVCAAEPLMPRPFVVIAAALSSGTLYSSHHIDAQMSSLGMSGLWLVVNGLLTSLCVVHERR